MKRVATLPMNYQEELYTKTIMWALLPVAFILQLFGGRPTLITLCIASVVAYISDIVGFMEGSLITLIGLFGGVFATIMYAARNVLTDSLLVNLPFLGAMGATLFYGFYLTALQFGSLVVEFDGMIMTMYFVTVTTLPLVAAALLTWFLCLEVLPPPGGSDSSDSNSNNVLDSGIVFAVCYFLYLMWFSIPSSSATRRLQLQQQQQQQQSQSQSQGKSTPPVMAPPPVASPIMDVPAIFRYGMYAVGVVLPWPLLYTAQHHAIIMHTLSQAVRRHSASAVHSASSSAGRGLGELGTDTLVALLIPLLLMVVVAEYNETTSGVTVTLRRSNTSHSSVGDEDEEGEEGDENRAAGGGHRVMRSSSTGSVIDSTGGVMIDDLPEIGSNNSSNNSNGQQSSMMNVDTVDGSGATQRRAPAGAGSRRNNSSSGGVGTGLRSSPPSVQPVPTGSPAQQFLQQWLPIAKVLLALLLCLCLHDHPLLDDLKTLCSVGRGTGSTASRLLGKRRRGIVGGGTNSEYYVNYHDQDDQHAVANTLLCLGCVLAVAGVVLHKRSSFAVTSSGGVMTASDSRASLMAKSPSNMRIAFTRSGSLEQIEGGYYDQEGGVVGGGGGLYRRQEDASTLGGGGGGGTGTGKKAALEDEDDDDDDIVVLSNIPVTVCMAGSVLCFGLLIGIPLLVLPACIAGIVLLVEYYLRQQRAAAFTAMAAAMGSSAESSSSRGARGNISRRSSREAGSFSPRRKRDGSSSAAETATTLSHVILSIVFVTCAALTGVVVTLCFTQNTVWNMTEFKFRVTGIAAGYLPGGTSGESELSSKYIYSSGDHGTSFTDATGDSSATVSMRLFCNLCAIAVGLAIVAPTMIVGGSSGGGGGGGSGSGSNSASVSRASSVETPGSDSLGYVPSSSTSKAAASSFSTMMSTVARVLHPLVFSHVLPLRQSMFNLMFLIVVLTVSFLELVVRHQEWQDYNISASAESVYPTSLLIGTSLLFSLTALRLHFSGSGEATAAGGAGEVKGLMSSSSGGSISSNSITLVTVYVTVLTQVCKLWLHVQLGLQSMGSILSVAALLFSYTLPFLLLRTTLGGSSSNSNNSVSSSSNSSSSSPSVSEDRRASTPPPASPAVADSNQLLAELSNGSGGSSSRSASRRNIIALGWWIEFLYNVTVTYLATRWVCSSNPEGETLSGGSSSGSVGGGGGGGESDLLHSRSMVAMLISTYITHHHVTLVQQQAVCAALWGAFMTTYLTVLTAFSATPLPPLPFWWLLPASIASSPTRAQLRTHQLLSTLRSLCFFVTVLAVLVAADSLGPFKIEAVEIVPEDSSSSGDGYLWSMMRWIFSALFSWTYWLSPSNSNGGRFDRSGSEMQQQQPLPYYYDLVWKHSGDSLLYSANREGDLNTGAAAAMFAQQRGLPQHHLSAELLDAAIESSDNTSFYLFATTVLLAVAALFGGSSSLDHSSSGNKLLSSGTVLRLLFASILAYSAGMVLLGYGFPQTLAFEASGGEDTGDHTYILLVESLYCMGSVFLAAVIVWRCSQLPPIAATAVAQGAQRPSVAVHKLLMYVWLLLTGLCWYLGRVHFYAQAVAALAADEANSKNSGGSTKTAAALLGGGGAGAGGGSVAGTGSGSLTVIYEATTGYHVGMCWVVLLVSAAISVTLRYLVWARELTAVPGSAAGSATQLLRSKATSVTSISTKTAIAATACLCLSAPRRIHCNVAVPLSLLLLLCNTGVPASVTAAAARQGSHAVNKSGVYTSAATFGYWAQRAVALSCFFWTLSALYSMYVRGYNTTPSAAAAAAGGFNPSGEGVGVLPFAMYYNSYDSFHQHLQAPHSPHQQRGSALASYFAWREVDVSVWTAASSSATAPGDISAPTHTVMLPVFNTFLLLVAWPVLVASYRHLEKQRHQPLAGGSGGFRIGGGGGAAGGAGKGTEDHIFLLSLLAVIALLGTQLVSIRLLALTALLVGLHASKVFSNSSYHQRSNRII